MSEFKNLIVAEEIYVLKIFIVLIFLSGSFFSIAEDLSPIGSTQLKSWSVEVFSSPGATSNTYMSQIMGAQFLYRLDHFSIFAGLSEPTYSNDLIVDTALASNQINKRTNSMMFQLGVRKDLAYYSFLDFAVGMNLFSYKYSGVDLSCCVNFDFSRQYNFNGIFVNPSIGFRYDFERFAVGIKIFSWLEYLSKNTTDKSNSAEPINSNIKQRLDSYDSDTVQSSGLLPPTVFFSYHY